MNPKNKASFFVPNINPNFFILVYSEKYCLDKDWVVQTNYSTCALVPVYTRRHEFHINILLAAIGVTLPALVIFIAFKNLWKLRVALHRNLLIAFILRCILTITSKQVIILDALEPLSETNNVMKENSVACRVLSFFENVSKNAIFTCMLVDGFYLHKLIVRTFVADPNAYLLHGMCIGSYNIIYF